VILQGISASTGGVTGPVVNLETTDAKQNMPCILVVKYFTPDIIINFRNIIGIITENGGATCHAAILARTMSIPCVAGVRDVTKILRTGQRVILEASALSVPGTVEVVEE